MKCAVDVAPVRAEPADDAEQVTQALRGEPLRVEERRDGWARVVTAYDYPGWVRADELEDGEGELPADASGSPIDVALTLPDARHVELAVCDRGGGVPEAERERIFEPFFRARGTREGDGGVGLGLSLVRAIARKHGGEARCAARSGGGTSFTVFLKRSPSLP